MKQLPLISVNFCTSTVWCGAHSPVWNQLPGRRGPLPRGLSFYGRMAWLGPRGGWVLRRESPNVEMLFGLCLHHICSSLWPEPGRWPTPDSRGRRPPRVTGTGACGCIGVHSATAYQHCPVPTAAHWPLVSGAACVCMNPHLLWDSTPFAVLSVPMLITRGLNSLTLQLQVWHSNFSDFVILL